MKKVLFDTNIILDIALNRKPFFDLSARLFELIDKKKIKAYVTASTITDIYYIAKKDRGNEMAIQFIQNLLEIVEVLGVDKDVIIDALNMEMNDFEDAVQVSAAKSNEVATIITRNNPDFTKSGLEIFTPPEFIESLK
jgi:predicted nucleic acid-binding protein